MNYRIAAGSSEPLGVTPADGGINIAVYSAHATAIEICLFDAHDTEQARLLLPERSGDIHHGFVTGVPVGTRYGLRAHGPYAPREGHRFNPAKLLVDPYALELDRPFALAPELFGFADGDPLSASAIDTRDSATDVPKAIVTDREALQRASTAVRVPWPDTVIYELHVRGFTRQHPDIPESIRGTFAALAHPAAIAHLKHLGITTVELMPAMAWIDERHLPPLGLSNYWGYNPLALLAPDSRLAPGGWREVRAATDALHAAGIEVLLDAVLNHSGESDELGPTISFRGLDNASYYRLAPDAPARYVNDMGTGNCLALNRPVLVRLAMDALRAWMELGGIDGFRFDLATALGRRADGFDPHAPLLAAIEQDPMLREAKLIAEPWDMGPGGYQMSRFPARWGEWNDRFRDDVRRFWRGDAGLRGALATRLAGSSDLLAGKRHPSRSINFVVAHDGFTLADLVAHEGKHNETNGEGNRDGTDANHSWSHGVEGASDDMGLLATRKQDQRNLLATLLLANGTPMLAMGAELGQTQHGNNNAYAQDNATTWLDWAQADCDLIEFTRRTIALRRAQPGTREDRFFDGEARDASGLPDIEWCSARAPLVDDGDWERTDPDTLVAVRYADGVRQALAIHRGACDIDLALPTHREGFAWQRVLDTTGIDAADNTHLAARSVAVFVEVAETHGGRIHDIDGQTLTRLAAAAGIAGEWWDVSGTRHAVGADTQRHLLAAMGLPADTSTEARASLQRFSERGERRFLPPVKVVRQGRPDALRIAVDAACSLPRGRAAIRNEAGDVVAQLAADDAMLALERDRCGQRLRIGRLPLPTLDAGHYTVALDSVPDVVTRLTVAPQRCHRPVVFDAAGHPFGLTVQAYALRRAADFGVGDFGAIGEFAALAAKQGAATVGLNPLHMLFAGDRERASPYYPSDRRFLDPLYLDPDALADLPGFAGLQACWRDDATRKALADAAHIDYPRVWALKRLALERLHVEFARLAQAQPAAAVVREFDAYAAAGGETLRRFATFQALTDQPGQGDLRTWDAGLRDAGSTAVAAFAERHALRLRYHTFLQWLCERQLTQAAARGREAGLALGLYRDLAVGAAPDGAEAWANAPMFAHGVSIGAPPDPLALQGQVWNLPPPNPLAWRERGYATLREVLAANMRHAGMLRIDHVLGLARLFWVPDGGSAADGAYVACPLDDLLGEVALESVRAQCAVVGEDLGTVPDGLREKLADHGMLRYQVMLLERDGVGFKPPTQYASAAVACACTHDLPPLAGWWLGEDIRERASLGLLSDETAHEQLVVRQAEKRALAEAVAQAGGTAALDIDAPLDDAALAALHGWLAAAPSAMRFAQAEDLAGETIGQNLPGTDRERPNWRRRLPMTVDALLASPRAQAVLRAFGQCSD